MLVLTKLLYKQYPLRLITSRYPVAGGYHSLCQEEVDFLLYSGISLSGTAVSNQTPHIVCRQITVMLWTAPVYRSVHWHVHSGSDFTILFYF